MTEQQKVVILEQLRALASQYEGEKNSDESRAFAALLRAVCGSVQTNSCIEQFFFCKTIYRISNSKAYSIQSI